MASGVAEAHGITERKAKALWAGRMSREMKVSKDWLIEVVVAPFYSLRQARYGPGSWLRESDLPGMIHAIGPATDPEAWWKSLPREARIAVLRAFCYEALLDVTSVTREKCSNCGGRGTIVRRGLGDLSARDSTCPRCMGTAMDIGSPETSFHGIDSTNG